MSCLLVRTDISERSLVTFLYKCILVLLWPKKISNGFYVKFLNHCKPMKRCPLKMSSLAFTFAACILLCNKGRISIEINKLRGHIIHSNLTRLLSYFCISSLTNVSLMRPTEWTSHLLNFFKWNPAEELFPSKTVHYWGFEVGWFSLINYQLSIYYNCTSN